VVLLGAVFFVMRAKLRQRADEDEDDHRFDANDMKIGDYGHSHASLSVHPMHHDDDPARLRSSTRHYRQDVNTTTMHDGGGFFRISDDRPSYMSDIKGMTRSNSFDVDETMHQRRRLDSLDEELHQYDHHDSNEKSSNERTSATSSSTSSIHDVEGFEHAHRAQHPPQRQQRTMHDHTQANSFDSYADIYDSNNSFDSYADMDTSNAVPSHLQDKRHHDDNDDEHDSLDTESHLDIDDSDHAYANSRRRRFSRYYSEASQFSTDEFNDDSARYDLDTRSTRVSSSAGLSPAAKRGATPYLYLPRPQSELSSLFDNEDHFCHDVDHDHQRQGCHDEDSYHRRSSSSSYNSARLDAYAWS
jgi:hypothetical protein